MTVAVKPGLAKCSPERHAGHLAFTPWFRNWCLENGIAVRDLQRILRLKSVSQAEGKLDGKRPLNMIDISLFPLRYRHQLTSMWLAYCDAAERDGRLSSHG